MTEQLSLPLGKVLEVKSVQAVTPKHSQHMQTPHRAGSPPLGQDVLKDSAEPV